MFVKITNSHIEYPYNITRLRYDFPNVSFPSGIESDYATLSDFGVFLVHHSSQPNYDKLTQKLIEMEPIEINERWHKAWKIVDLNEEEIQNIIKSKSDEVRAERNRLLIESDPLVMIDRWNAYSQERKDAITSYRQSLRDISSQEGFPFDVEFPSLILPE